MGQPVKIVDLAERIIRLSGLEPGRDIQIAFTGIRPGERLHEILFAREEETIDIGIPGIVATKPVQPSLEAIRAWVATLEQGLARNERAVIYNVLRDAVPEFRGEAAHDEGIESCDGPDRILQSRIRRASRRRAAHRSRACPAPSPAWWRLASNRSAAAAS